MSKEPVWVGSSKKDFSKFPVEVQAKVETALSYAQEGDKSPHAKPLLGFSGARVLEIVERDRSGTYRCVYTVKFPSGIYVLHAFQKKSHKGIETPKADIEMIKRRLKVATEMDAEAQAQIKKGKKK